MTHPVAYVDNVLERRRSVRQLIEAAGKLLQVEDGKSREQAARDRGAEYERGITELILAAASVEPDTAYAANIAMDIAYAAIPVDLRA